ncbi:group-specific protein (plasmid) [Neobacillus sp. SCS-31]|uniref:group-specific protein n=1 Tax=Neobacillus oceani TaxID=3115292 RepID=UPI00390651A4
MINIEIDQQEARELYLKKIEEAIQRLDLEKVFWDSKELQRRTCLSWSTIQTTFFYDPRFPKYKVGGKWMYPARETQEFLLTWLKEHK